MSFTFHLVAMIENNIWGGVHLVLGELGAEQPGLDCGKIAANKRLRLGSLFCFAVLPGAYSASRLLARRFKQGPVRIVNVSLPATETGEFRKQIIVPLA